MLRDCTRRLAHFHEAIGIVQQTQSCLKTNDERLPSASGRFCHQETPFEHIGSSLGSRRIQDDVNGLGILPCVENSVDVDVSVGQNVVYRKRETL